MLRDFNYFKLLSNFPIDVAPESPMYLCLIFIFKIIINFYIVKRFSLKWLEK